MGLEQNLPDREALEKRKTELKRGGWEEGVVSRMKGKAKVVKRLGSNAQTDWEQRLPMWDYWQWESTGEGSFFVPFQDSRGLKEPTSRTAVT